MHYKAFGKTGYSVSTITYGGIVSMRDGQDASDRYVPWAIDRGVNYFDVAPTYGDAQEKLGNSLRPYRKDVYLACKTKCRTAKEAEKELEESQRLLHTDYFDVYQMHEMASLRDVEIAFGPGGVMELMRKKKEEGVVRKIGITCHSEPAALKALELFPFDTVLFPFNWHMNLGHGFGNALLEKAKERGMGILCMKSMIERAWMADEDRSRYPKSWCKPFNSEDPLLLLAVKYAWSLGVNTLIPPGNFEHFSYAVEHEDEIVNHPITDEELAILKAHLETVKDHPFFGAEMMVK